MPRPVQPKHSETNTSQQRTQSRPKPVFRSSVIYFLGALVVNIFISPVVDRLSSGALIEAMLITLLLLCAVLSIAGGRRALVGGCVAGACHNTRMVELLAAGAVDLRGDPRSRPAVHRVRSCSASSL